VNSVKALPLNSRLFALLCEKMHALEVWWLSKGKVLKRVFHFKENVRSILQDCVSQHFLYKKWPALPPHLLDIFDEFRLTKHFSSRSKCIFQFMTKFWGS
jgi:hypothetical protein